MRYSAAAFAVAAAVAVGALGASLAALHSSVRADGTLSGSVVVTTGLTSLRPTHTVTVELESDHMVVARDREAPGATFRFHVRARHYRLVVAHVKSCRATAEVRSNRMTSTLVRCALFAALRSVAFATLPMRGAIKTKADALKRFLSFAKRYGSTRIGAAETRFDTYVTLSSTGGSWSAPPTHVSETAPVWVACATGGTYTSFNGTSGYSSACNVSLASTGEGVANTDNDAVWPAWFTRLPSPTTPGQHKRCMTTPQ